MTESGDRVPPLEFIWYSLGEAIELLTDLQDVIATLTDSGHLAGVVLMQAQARLLARKLEDEDPEGDTRAE